MKKVIAPKGFFFRIVKDYYSSWSVQLCLKETGHEVGHVNLCHEYSGCYSTHSHLDSKYRGRKLGAIMYAKAIQFGMSRGWRVRSSGGSSEDAQRVWRGSTLKRWFEIKVRKGRDYYTKELNPHCDTFFPKAKEEKRKRCRVSSKKRPAKKRR